MNVLVLDRRHRHDETLQQLVGYNPQRIEWHQVPQTLPAPQPTLQEPPRVSTNDLPSSDWPTFRADCRRLLAPDLFATVDRAYCEQYQLTRARLAADVDKTVAETSESIARGTLAASTMTEALVRIRAMQAAYFRHGFNLRISRDKLLQGVAQARSQRFAAGDFAALRAYREPHRAALCTLHDAGYPQDQLNRVTIREVATALDTQTLHGLPLHPDARPFLYAAMLLRARDGATPLEPLIPLDTKTIGRKLSRASTDVGLFVGNPYSGTNRHTLNFWQYRDGFHCERIPT